MDVLGKEFQVLGYRTAQKGQPDFQKSVRGRSEAARLAVMLKNAQPSFYQILIFNSEGETIMDLSGEK